MRKPRFHKENFFSLRQKAEEELRLNEDEKSASEFEHELSVYEIELRMQNAELLEAQEKLNASLLEYSELFELSPVGYFILNEEGVIENVNLRGTVQLGIDREHLIKQPFSVFLVSESDQDDFYRLLKRAAERGNLERMEREIKRKDGDVFHAFIKVKLTRNEKFQFKHLLTIMTDISEIKEHERQMELQLTRSEELSNMKSRFIGMASHEFRTPLTSILSSTMLIEKYARLREIEKMDKHLNRIKLSVKNMVNILEEFLSIEKLESGKVKIQREKFSLPDFCNGLVDETMALKRKGQSIHCRHQGPEFIIEDQKILQHVILNLLSNACKYSPEEKGIYLLTNVTDSRITIVVEDQGIGIPQADQNNIFTRFFRANNAANIQGTGLGLNIVKRYVELLSGTIDFVSTENKGTTFTVAIPRIRSFGMTDH